MDETELSMSAIARLPEPARRLLAASFSDNAPMSRRVELVMEGEFKLNDWLPFNATQLITAFEGFTWEAKVGNRPITFSGSDSYSHGVGELDFKLWGLIPVASGKGPDISRSAADRLIIESVAWLPQSLMAENRTTWDYGTTDSASVMMTVDGRTRSIDTTVDSIGRLTEVSMLRWGDPDSTGYRDVPFGAAFDDWYEFDGVTIPVSGKVAWWWKTPGQAEGEFFRFRITEARYL